MNSKRSWAVDWKLIDGPQRESNRDVVSAIFGNSAGDSVRVRVTGQELNVAEWGRKPEKLEDIRKRTEEILRAILERYAQTHDKLPPEIDARDLLNDLWKLSREFAESAPQSEAEEQ